MAAPNSALHVAQFACGFLNQKPIAGFTDTADKLTALCILHNDQSRRAALRRHTWNFATKRASIPALVGSPEFGYSTWFRLPNDYLRLIGIGEEQTATDYRCEGGNLLIDSEGASALSISYIWDFTNVGQMDPLFIDVWSLEWAIRMAKPMGASATLITELREWLAEIRLDAEAIDGQEQPIQRINKSRLLRARRGSLGGNQSRFED